MARVTWSREALSRLELIRAYIGQFDRKAARRIADSLVAAGESLGDFPKRGRPAKGGVREMPTVPPYILRYIVGTTRFWSSTSGTGVSAVVNSGTQIALSYTR